MKICNYLFMNNFAPLFYLHYFKFWTLLAVYISTLLTRQLCICPTLSSVLYTQLNRKHCCQLRPLLISTHIHGITTTSQIFLQDHPLPSMQMYYWRYFLGVAVKELLIVRRDGLMRISSPNGPI